MKTLDLTQSELNAIHFAIKTRLNAIRGYHTFEEDELQSVLNKIDNIK